MHFVRSAALSVAVIGMLAAAPARGAAQPERRSRWCKSLDAGWRAHARHSAIGHAARAASAPAVSLNVLFATGSAELTPEAIQTLDDLGRALTDPALAAYRFRLEGHTDTVGGRDYNKALSDRRAITVAEYLGRPVPRRSQPAAAGWDGPGRTAGADSRPDRRAAQPPGRWW